MVLRSLLFDNDYVGYMIQCPCLSYLTGFKTSYISWTASSVTPSFISTCQITVFILLLLCGFPPGRVLEILIRLHWMTSYHFCWSLLQWTNQLCWTWAFRHDSFLSRSCSARGLWVSGCPSHWSMSRAAILIVTVRISLTLQAPTGQIPEKQLRDPESRLMWTVGLAYVKSRRRYIYWLLGYNKSAFWDHDQINFSLDIKSFPYFLMYKTSLFVQVFDGLSQCWRKGCFWNC